MPRYLVVQDEAEGTYKSISPQSLKDPIRSTRAVPLRTQFNVRLAIRFAQKRSWRSEHLLRTAG